MQQRPESTPEDASAIAWLGLHARSLFAVVRRVVPDSLCAYDLGHELSALVKHRWEWFDAGRDATRMAWSIRLASELIATAIARGVVPTRDRQRAGEALMLTVSPTDLHELTQIARAPLPLDEDAADALAALEHSVRSHGSPPTLGPSHLVCLATSDSREDG